MPSLLGVAVIAFLAQPALVRIVCFVTAETAPGGLAVFHALCMAAIAACSLVGTHQCEVGERMVEGLAIELNNVELTPFVLGVARLALPFRCFGVAPVESTRGLPVCSNRLVAGQAKPGLRLARKGLVTVVAVLFQLCMSADERTRHDELFEYTL